jgi:hypothetical protein
MQFLGDNRWLVVVLPGFFALFVAGFISDFPQVRDSQLPIVYVALTALSVAIPFGALHIYGRVRKKQFSVNLLLRKPAFVAGIFVTSVVLGFIFGILNTTDVVSRDLRAIFGKDIILTSSQSEVLKVLFKLSYSADFAEYDGWPGKGGSDGVTNFISDDLKRFRNRYVKVNFGEKRNSYEGVVTSFYEGSEKPQVYMSPACLEVDPENGTG